MASFAITREDLFPNGTSVAAYPLANWSQAQLPPSGAPQGSPTETVTMTAGVAQFVALAASTRYVAYGLVGGEHRYVNFSTFPDSPQTQLAAQARTYRIAQYRSGNLAAAAGAGTRYLLPVGTALSSAPGMAAPVIFHLKAALWAPPTGMSLRLNLAAGMVTNATAQTGLTWTFKLVPVTASGGAAGVVSFTPGTAIAASTVTHVAPAANQPDLYLESGDFAMPADGAYVISVTNDLQIPVAADVAFHGTLLWRWV